MKKFLSMLLAVAMMTAGAISASAAGDAGLYYYDESDGEYWAVDLSMFDKTVQGIWFEDGSVAGHNIAQLADGTALEENAMSNLESGWYEVVLCNLGSTAEMFPADVEGKIALCVRGGSTFTVKSENALNAGAVAMLMGNNCRSEEMVDETGAISTETYANITMNLDYATLPMGSVSSDVTVRLVAATADISIADAVAAVTAVFNGNLDLGLEHKTGAWVYIGTEAEYKANTTRTAENTKTGAAEAAAEVVEEAPVVEEVVEETVVEETPVVEEEVVEETVVEEVVVEEVVVEETVEEVVVEEAAQTFDFGVVAAVAAIVSAAGYAISKKR